MTLYGRHIADFTMKPDIIVEIEPGREVCQCFNVVREHLRIVLRTLGSREQRLDERVVVGRSWAGKLLTDAKLFQEFLEWLGLHLRSTVIEQFQLFNLLWCQTFSLNALFNQFFSLCIGHAPTNPKRHDLS